MFRGFIVGTLATLAILMVIIMTPERRTVILYADINDYRDTPSALREAFEQGWTLTNSDGRRVYSLERSRLRLQ